MPYYVTKYALTKGILEFSEENSELCTHRGHTSLKSGFFWIDSNDFSTDLEVAKRRADELRKRKIASLKKQITKLDSVSEFTIKKVGDK